MKNRNMIKFLFLLILLVVSGRSSLIGSQELPSSTEYGAFNADDFDDIDVAKRQLRTTFIAAVNHYLKRYSPRLISQNDDYVKMSAKYEYQIDVELTINESEYLVTVTIAQDKYKYDRAQNVCVKIAAGTNKTYINLLSRDAKSNGNRNTVVPVSSNQPATQTKNNITPSQNDTAQVATYRNLAHKSDFENEIYKIKQGQESRRPVYRQNNSISLYLDKGMLEHYAGNYRNSSLDLQEAERLIEEAFTKSITADAASYIANDNTKEYPGEDYEDIYINIFNALNYYHNNDIDGAMVEIRKITMSSGKLDMLSRKYVEGQKSISDWAMKRLNTIGIKSRPDLPQGDPVNFSNSALARYLGALFYQAQGNLDSARIEFEQIPIAFNGNKKIYYNSIPATIENSQNTANGQTRLHIIGFTGLSPIKEEKIFKQYFPYFKNVVLQHQQLELPILVRRPSSISRIEINVHDYGVFDLELLEDMGAVATETYNARFANMYFKTYVRTMLKYAAADVASSQTSKQIGRVAGDRVGNIVGFAASIGSKVAVDASEKADIRMGKFFPDKSYIGGINLDPGTYNIAITFFQGNFPIVKEEYKDIIIRANQLNLIEVFAF